MKYRIVKRTKKKLAQAKQKLGENIDLMMSRRLNVEEVQTVCLMLGPYRNLTTLTASTMFLHPNCQVLNHAGSRIFGNRAIDFLLDGNHDKLNRFIQFSVQASAKGARGDEGGSITFSHAFDGKHQMNELRKKNHTPLIKKNVRCLLWKESQRTANIIRERSLDMGRLLENESRLRFLLPIRHPLDCATSNLRTGHVRFLRGCSTKPSVEEVARSILDEIFWFHDLQRSFPDRFFSFFEHTISQDMLTDLAAFLKLSPDEQWISDALSSMSIRPGYAYDSKTTDAYKRYVSRKEEEFPSLVDGLLEFVG